MRRIDSTIRAAVCVSALAAACVLAMGQSAPPGAGNQTAQGNAGGQAGAATGQTAAYAAKPLPIDQKPLALDQQIAALVAQPAVARAHWGVMVTTLDGRPIYALNEGQLFQPDSNAKLFTTATAMALLGRERRFETQVFAEGSITTLGELNGDLVLHGGGDVNFASSLFPYLPPSQQPANATQTPPSPLAVIDDLADQVVAKGLKVVDGDVVGDDSYFAMDPYPLGWAADDLLWGYGAPVSALTIHDNQIDVTITPTPKDSLSSEIRFSPDLPYYSGTRSVRTWDVGDGNSVLFEREQGSKDLSITGRVAASAGPEREEIAIEIPAEYAALALKTALEARGVKVKGVVRARHWDPKDRAQFMPATRQPVFLPFFQRALTDHSPFVCDTDAVGSGQEGARTVLATHLSPPLEQDLILTNKTSQNLHAEIMLRNIAATYECEHTARKGVQWVRQYLLYAGVDKDDFVFYDGSGLSGKDLVTPRAVAKLLSFAAHDPKTGAPQPWFADWKASLPVGGVDGTLADRFTTAPLKGHV